MPNSIAFEVFTGFFLASLLLSVPLLIAFSPDDPAWIGVPPGDQLMGGSDWAAFPPHTSVLSDSFTRHGREFARSAI
jgi:hypothetical protein